MSNDPLFSEWRTYEKVVAQDYMHHRLYFDALTDELLRRFSGPVRILDLGCGDARPLVNLLERVRVSHYVGIDESAEALSGAALLLAEKGVSNDLYPMSMVDLYNLVSEPFDVMLASYSLHHLSEAGKGLLLEQCRKRLAPGGVFALVDVFMEAGESRLQYIDRWRANAQQHFSALSPPELTLLLDHVSANDQPESVATMQALASRAGFVTAEPVAVGPERLNAFVLMTTS